VLDNAKAITLMMWNAHPYYIKNDTPNNICWEIVISINYQRHETLLSKTGIIIIPRQLHANTPITHHGDGQGLDSMCEFDDGPEV
jgi:hypothetical protein